ncbi:MAG TPA: 2-phosphosulfolactate phosphatase [Lacipirellulaceae bacterium]|nr:2-phosphosulfolactate phosphatase [Lacipirellulaceae bacterium]
MPHRILNVHYLPRSVPEQDLSGSAVIVIDLLRATTTICYALAAGAEEVVPFRTIEEAYAAAEKAGRENVVLGGERGGQRIDGFDLGNSPSEYTPDAIRGRPVYITTTNGTQALHHARMAQRVLAGSIVNLSAVTESVEDEERIDVVCAGTDGHETGEDILAAGAIVRRMIDCSKATCRTNMSAEAALREWNTVLSSAAKNGRSLSKELAIEFRDTLGGRNLIDVGLERDLMDCAQVDYLDIVPELDTENWRITLR